MIEYKDPILDLEFRELIRNNPNDYYCALVQVFYDDSPIENPNREKIISRIKENKDKLERFVEVNNI